MCTAISYHANCHYFGRNLDLDYHYQETVTIAPRNFPVAGMNNHFAMIGMATIVNGYPLFYEGTNEKGLSIAGLNFPGYAKYCEAKPGKRNIPSYDVIPTVLGACTNIRDVKNYLSDAVITNQPFSQAYRPTPLHWFAADKHAAIAIEITDAGLSVLDNPVGVLSNSPPLPYHLENLSNYIGLSREVPVCQFADNLQISPFSNGQGAFGLPGDFSSASRFVRAAFDLHNSAKPNDELNSVSQFFHILSAVQQPDGCVRVGDKFQKTLYSSCCNTDTGVYYYKTYDNQQITAVNMHSVDLSDQSLTLFPLRTKQQICWETEKGPC